MQQLHGVKGLERLGESLVIKATLSQDWVELIVNEDKYAEKLIRKNGTDRSGEMGFKLKTVNVIQKDVLPKTI